MQCKGIQECVGRAIVGLDPRQISHRKAVVLVTYQVANRDIEILVDDLNSLHCNLLVVVVVAAVALLDDGCGCGCGCVRIKILFECLDIFWGGSAPASQIFTDPNRPVQAIPAWQPPRRRVQTSSPHRPIEGETGVRYWSVVSRFCPPPPIKKKAKRNGDDKKMQTNYGGFIVMSTV